MKERPIIFNSDLIPKILDGDKRMTRKVIKPQPTNKHGFAYLGNAQWRFFYQKYAIGSLYDHFEAERVIKCPYGQVGGKLWVRETFCDYCIPEGEMSVCYKACPEKQPAMDFCRAMKWRPSIHMPRWASRISLEIIKIRVERLQEITTKDAQVEGCGGIVSFFAFWDSLNAKRGYSWESNPFVWVIEFMELPKE